MNPSDNSSPNPLRIDNNLLIELGLSGLPSHEKTGFLNHIYETLEMRVGIRLADQMTNEQLDEFETFYNAKDDAGAFRWLETNFPNYKEIVADEFSKLKGEIAQQAPQILAASQQQAASAQPSQPTEQPVQQPYPQQPAAYAQQPTVAPSPQPPVDDGTLYVAPQSQQPSVQPQQPDAQPYSPQPTYPQSQPVSDPNSTQPPQQYPPQYPPQQQPPIPPTQQW